MEPHLPAHPLNGAAAPPAAGVRDLARAGLYVHVPFCAARCSYCDFSSGPLADAQVARWHSALVREAAQREHAASGTAFTSVFFGGGTPSALSAERFRELWHGLAGRFALAPGAEVTLEANPESVRPERLEAWAACGVDRLSMGAQSFHADELERLGRIHDAARPAEAFERARAHGFRHLSLDLIFGFPGHTLARWRETLERALALEPEHLSAYCFIPENGTPLGDVALAGVVELPSAAEQADLHACFVETSASAGMSLYETSNAARPGTEARHNLTYWLRRPYLGLGPSAHGFWDGVRYANRRAPAEWAAALEAGESGESEREAETPASVAEEILMLALRLSSGLRPSDHGPRAWRLVEERFGAALAEAVASGRLEAHREGWRIPPHHTFVADDTIAWIAARAREGGFDSAAGRSVVSTPCPSPPSPVI
jgi:oxygen-independent coproporphyrinogen III oxidase